MASSNKMFLKIGRKY